MGAFLDMVRANDLRPGDVRSIRVGTNRHMPNALIHHRPTNELAAKFSMEFCLAILLIERRAGLAEFTDAVVNRPDVQEVIRRITFEADPAADEGGFQQMTSLIEVTLVDGRVLRERAEFAHGSPAKPMTDEALIDKFLACLAWAEIGEDVGRKLSDAVMTLEHQPSVRDVVGLLRATTSVGATRR
jgi:2-methylcitrate dehydratase PrpD